MKAERRRERGARALAGRERGRQAGLQPEHLGARIQAEAEAGTIGEDCSQPPDGVTETMLPSAVDDVDVHGVAALFGQMRHGRLVDGAGLAEAAPSIAMVSIILVLEARHAARAKLERGVARRSACGARRYRRPTADDSIGTSAKSGSP